MSIFKKSHFNVLTQNLPFSTISLSLLFYHFFGIFIGLCFLFSFLFHVKQKYFQNVPRETIFDKKVSRETNKNIKTTKIIIFQRLNSQKNIKNYKKTVKKQKK